MPKISIASDETQSLVVKYQSLVTKSIVKAKEYQSLVIRVNR